jgi:hypothetical protein
LRQCEVYFMKRLIIILKKITQISLIFGLLSTQTLLADVHNSKEKSLGKTLEDIVAPGGQ